MISAVVGRRTAKPLGVGASQSQTFNYTGAAQTWTKPIGVTSVTIDLMGAEAGRSTDDGYAIPGKGGRVQCTRAAGAAEETWNIYIGGKPGNTGLGGFNGGGAGEGIANGHPGGGGASDIRVGGTALSNRVVVAGGGGGHQQASSNGGAGGGTTGGAGVSTQCGTCPNTPNGTPGQGGTQAAGGAGGTGAPSIPTANAGTLGNGGAGGAGGGGAGGNGPGGGGGYYGGGGGQGEYDDGVENFHMGNSAGGGSSFTDASCSGVVHTQGHQSGNGQLVLTWTA